MGRVFKPLTSFQTKESFEKIYYKYIPLYSFVCFEPNFKAIESLKLLIFPDTFFCHNFLNIVTKLRAKIYS